MTSQKHTENAEESVVKLDDVRSERLLAQAQAECEERRALREEILENPLPYLAKIDKEKTMLMQQNAKLRCEYSTLLIEVISAAEELRSALKESHALLLRIDEITKR